MPISYETKLLFEYLKNYDGLIPILNDIFDLTQGYVFEHRLHKPLNYELTEGNIKPIMLDFYDKHYTKPKAEEVRDILSGKSTYFTGENGYHVNFLKGEGKSKVSFYPKNDYAEFFVYIDKNCLNVLKITAHELSHAISSYNKNVVTCAREHKKRDTNFHPEHDAIREVESYITEALFLNYMLSKGMITIDDGLDYYREGMSFIHNVIGEAFEKKVLVLPYSERSIRIAFSAASYEYPEFLRFKTYMENNDDGWTDFRNETVKEYSNLSPGTYVFHVIAKNCYDNESQEATLTIKIIAPWYMSLWAVIFYVLVFALLIWLIVKAYTKKLIRDKQKLEQIVEQRTAEIRQQSKLIMEKNEEITEKNKSITDSIEYALHIQQAMLPLKDKIDNALPINFILYRPKDIVSGDYYWFAETDKKIIITAADCTGHGVPGAFMSMIGSQILTEIISDGITSADEILTNQNFRIRKALKQDTTENHDGMDMALCSIDKETHLVEYAGAKNPLIFIQNEEIQTIKADKQAIGGDQIQEDFHFTKHEIMPDGNTWFYMFSDGYEDQFGGPDGKKFKIKNLRELIFKIHNLPPEQQREILNTTIEEWIGPQGEQTDDIILMGFKL